MPLTQDAYVVRMAQQGPCCPVCQQDTHLFYDRPQYGGSYHPPGSHVPCLWGTLA
jgi:hypothetical protein